jgi:hypothetical protein
MNPAPSTHSYVSTRLAVREIIVKIFILNKKEGAG